jgi:hypothetical protein
VASSRALVRSGFGAALYEHGSVKIVALEQKDSQFTAILSGFGPVVGLWLDSPLYLLMGTNRLKMVAPVARNAYSRVVYPFFTLGSAIRPLYLLMPIKSAKVCALPKKNFSAWPPDARLVPTSAGQTRVSNILMHIESAKTIALEQRNFAFEKFTHRGGTGSAVAFSFELVRPAR